MLKRSFAALAALISLTLPALTQTRTQPPSDDITLGNAVKLGKREGNRTVITPDTLQILGPGSTGDASLMSAPPSLSAPENSISGSLARRMLLSGNDLSAFPEQSISDKIPYANTGARTFMYSNRTGRQASILGTQAIIRNTDGSGTFGPAAHDYALLTSIQKNDWMKSNVEGEINTQSIIARQGKKGDVGGILINVQKRRDKLNNWAANETGGITGVENSVALVDSAGQQYHKAHTIMGFAEVAGAFSEGRGYGFFSEARTGEWFSAYHAGSDNEATGSQPPALWTYYFSGAQSRNSSSLNYAVDRSGRTFSGFPSARMSWGFDAGQNAFTILDANGNNERFRILRDGGGMTLTGRYAAITLADPVTGPNAGGTHRIVSGGSGEMFYQVVNGPISWSVKPDGSFNVSNVQASAVTMSGLLKLMGYTVATLPTCNASNRDAVAVAIDLTTASSTTFRGVPAGGGAVRGPVYCDGSSWSVH
ncbi:hypothetical protein Mpop_4244 [Methylorubrum populi BJ001]|jgi:hypothetical protein|uniref:Uncharacterized protein n=1 Tax=Methylorubrum populi (strain ATCC BAA-705 / NCIMB 13946 / BJ001) TaxID=441620 RepID=B1ZDV7_METPB|nr:hypothetical protein [Methylorubrum populi]ACB82350.1 hypothetical protein Mpop_4244 [Methylorubrum populi BJ001]